MKKSKDDMKLLLRKKNPKQKFIKHDIFHKKFDSRKTKAAVIRQNFTKMLKKQ